MGKHLKEETRFESYFGLIYVKKGFAIEFLETIKEKVTFPDSCFFGMTLKGREVDFRLIFEVSKLDRNLIHVEVYLDTNKEFNEITKKASIARIRNKILQESL